MTRPPRGRRSLGEGPARRGPRSSSRRTGPCSSHGVPGRAKRRTLRQRAGRDDRLEREPCHVRGASGCGRGSAKSPASLRPAARRSRRARQRRRGSFRGRRKTSEFSARVARSTSSRPASVRARSAARPSCGCGSLAMSPVADQAFGRTGHRGRVHLEAGDHAREGEAAGAAERQQAQSTSNRAKLRANGLSAASTRASSSCWAPHDRGDDGHAVGGIRPSVSEPLPAWLRRAGPREEGGGRVTSLRYRRGRTGGPRRARPPQCGSMYTLSAETAAPNRDYLRFWLHRARCG